MRRSIGLGLSQLNPYREDNSVCWIGYNASLVGTALASAVLLNRFWVFNSQSRARPKNLLDLPDELLIKVASETADGPRSPGNLSLTCHRLCRIGQEVLVRAGQVNVRLIPRIVELLVRRPELRTKMEHLRLTGSNAPLRIDGWMEKVSDDTQQMIRAVNCQPQIHYFTDDFDGEMLASLLAFLPRLKHLTFDSKYPWAIPIVGDSAVLSFAGEVKRREQYMAMCQTLLRNIESLDAGASSGPKSLCLARSFSFKHFSNLKRLAIPAYCLHKDDWFEAQAGLYPPFIPRDKTQSILPASLETLQLYYAQLGLFSDLDGLDFSKDTLPNLSAIHIFFEAQMANCLEMFRPTNPFSGLHVTTGLQRIASGGIKIVTFFLACKHLPKYLGYPPLLNVHRYLEHLPQTKAPQHLGCAIEFSIKAQYVEGDLLDALQRPEIVRPLRGRTVDLHAIAAQYQDASATVYLEHAAEISTEESAYQDFLKMARWLILREWMWAQVSQVIGWLKRKERRIVHSCRRVWRWLL